MLFGGKTLFDYQGSIFWKMTAGMGDIVFAPLYEALRGRGVEFEFFHRVDHLHPSKDGRRIEAITMGRQARLIPGRTSYDPLSSIENCPASRPGPGRAAREAEGIGNHPLESHWCQWPDAEKRRAAQRNSTSISSSLPFRRGWPPLPARSWPRTPGVARHAGRPRDRRHAVLSTLARDSDADLGWSHPGSTLSAFVEPFSTWASMPQLIETEDWPRTAAPGAIAYFCGPLDAPLPVDARTPAISTDGCAITQSSS